MSRPDMDFPSFDLRLVTVFCVVAEELHLGRAAERLSVSRRAMARQIDDLEHQLGVTLVERGDRAVTLTAAGTRFLVGARAALDRALSVAAGFDGAGATLRVHVGEASNPVVRAVVAAYAAEHPDVTLEVAEGSGTASAHAVESGVADVGFDIADGVPGGLRFAALDRQPLGVVTRVEHPVVGPGAAPWSALEGERILVAPPGHADSYNVLVRTAARRGGVRVGEVVGPRVPRLVFVAPAVVAGRALVVCSRYAFTPLPPELAWPGLAPTRYVEVGLVWDEHAAGPSTRQFVELARSLSRVAGSKE